MALVAAWEAQWRANDLSAKIKEKYYRLYVGLHVSTKCLPLAETRDDHNQEPGDPEVVCFNM